MNIFAKRTAKEILRDPLSLFFGIGFPIILLSLFSLMSRHVPNDLFALPYLTPGIVVFGLSFMALFSAQLLSKDRSSSFLNRLFTTPLKPTDFILGYILPLIPMSIVQAVICYGCALLLGLPFTGSLFTAILTVLPTSILFIAIGLLCGCLFSERAVGGICGALLTNLTVWLSGTWFSLGFLGRGFETFAGYLPFVHAVEMSRAALSGNLSAIWPHLFWVLGYTVVLLLLSIWTFQKKMCIDCS